MQNFASTMTDEQLLEVVRAMDNVARPMDRRFEGDDDPIVDLMKSLNLNQTVVDKLLVTGEVLRECVNRGIQIPRGN
jgi:hypothetical protein